MRSAAIASVMLWVCLVIGCQPRPEPPEEVTTESPTTAATLPVPLPATTVPAASTLPAAVGHGREQYRVVSEPDEIVSVLGNGLTVIARRIASPACSVRGFVATGGLYEGKWLGGGLSHLLEHLVAGGSNQRRAEAQNRNLLQQIGNNSNAYTDFDTTAYFINTTGEHLDIAVDLVTGWMLGAKITPDEYEREHEVVQRELEMDLGNGDWVFYQLVNASRFRVSPARVPVIGYQPVIQGISREDVRAYYQQAYQPNNMVIAVVGDIDPERMLAAVQKHVDDAPPGRVFSHNIEPEPPVLAPRTVVATFPKLGQAKLSLGFPSVKLSDPDMYPLDVLAILLGQGESSILVQDFRERQLATHVSAGDWTPSFVEGTFQITLDLPPEKIGPATTAAWEQIERIKRDGVGADRLQRAKAQAKTARAFSLQAAEEVAGSLGNDYLSTGDPHFSDRYVERIGQVTAEQVKAAANKYLDRSRLITTALLPAESAGAAGLPKATDLLRAALPSSRPTTRESTPQTIRIPLVNDTTLLVKRISTTPVVSVRMLALGGLTAEDEKTNGLGNLTMLMSQRGTKTRSGDQIAEFFDSIGSNIETGCGNNTWSWGADCLKDDLDKMLEVLADVARNPSFPEMEMGGLRPRVMGAIEMQDADWYAQAIRYFRQRYFGPLHSPYQFLPIGTRENVPTFSAADMQKWYNEKVMAAPRVLAIYGDVDPEKAKALASKYFGGGAPATKAAETRPATSITLPPSAPAAQPSIEVRAVEVQKTENSYAGIVIGFDTRSVVADPDADALLVAKTMASGYSYPTGYLFETLRGQGLVYDVNSYPFPGRNSSLPGTFVVYAGCDPKNVDKVIDGILENIARLQGSEQDLQPGWFERARQLLITADAMRSETAGAQADIEAADELFGLGYDYHDRFANRVNAVKLADVQSVARARLRQCMVTVSTPRPQLVQTKPGSREYASFPPVDLTPRGVQHDTGK